MYIVPGLNAPEPQTARSRELGGRIEQAIRDFQREHPELTRREIRAALSHSMTLAGQDGLQKRRLVSLAVGGGAAAIGAVMAVSGSIAPVSSNVVWIVVAAIVGIGGLAIALMRMTNR